MLAKEVARLTGLSVRTLHYYDDLGLLRPLREEANGYRTYREEDLDTLQQILFFKACGFPLKQIRQILASPEFDRQAAFAFQREALLRERKKIDAMLDTLEMSIEAAKGEKTMDEGEKFGGFDFSRNPYEEEARQRWGDRAVEEGNARLSSLPADKRRGMEEEMNGLFRGHLDKSPAGEEAQRSIGELYSFFNANFGQYSPEAFAGLGRMYVEDPRFTENIDRFGEGLSAFLCEAMEIFAERQGQ